MPKPRIHIFTPCWGPHFTNLFGTALGMSFRWPKNESSLHNAIWTIVTDSPGQADMLTSLAKQILPTAEVRIQILPGLSKPNAPIGALKMEALLRSIKECLKEQTPMLMATPDFIYGDGTIETMLQTSLRGSSTTESTSNGSLTPNGSNLCVALAHIRCLPGTLAAIRQEFPDSTPDNKSLMKHAVENAHLSWTLSNQDSKNNACYHSGIFWRRLSSAETDTHTHTLLVSHHMPSPFLVNFIPKDYTGFSTWKGFTAPAFGEWDHNWPQDLIDQGRLRYIGSSDAACLLEITEADKNVPPPNQPEGTNGTFFLDGSHNRIQKQFLSVFRYY